MRFPVLLAAGVVLIAGGVALSEYARRHPDEKAKKDAKAESTPDAGVALPSADELTSHQNLVYEAPGADAFTAAGKHLEELAAAARPLEGIDAKAALGGTLSARGLVHAGDGIAFWVEEPQGPSASKARRYSLVWLGATTKVLATGRAGVGPIASDGKRLVWGEEGRLLSVSLEEPQVKGVVEFGKARVVALALAGDDVLAILSPVALDPFSTDPASVLVRFGADRNAKVLAQGLVRPQDLVSDGAKAYWLAGYPSSLQAVGLDGGPATTLSPNSEPPLAFLGDKLVFRRGGDAPGLYAVPAAGGDAAKVATGEIEKLGVDGERFAYALGNGVKLHQGEKDEALFELPSAPLEVAAAAGTVYVLTTDDLGQQVLLKKALH